MSKSAPGSQSAQSGRLRDLQLAARAVLRRQLGGGDAVAPAGEIAAQYAELVEIAAAAQQLAAPPTTAARRCDSGHSSGEELVAPSPDRITFSPASRAVAASL